MRPLRLFVVLLLGCACDGAASPATEDGEASEAASSGEAPRGCELEPRADAYALGMQKQGESFTVAFIDAMPAPPARGDNTWRVRVHDGDGVALGDATLSVDPFMPDHQHGTSIATHVVATDTPGEYELSPVNLFMPGLWDVTIGIEDEGRTDAVVFRFCVDP
jgi:hypothetical protein